MTRFRIPMTASLLMLAFSAPAQDLSDWGLGSFDPSALMASGTDLLMRAPDASIDGLFQAVRASARSPQDSRVLCELFDPQAERSLEGYNAIAAQLGQDSRTRFANAVADVFVSAAQSPRQPYDANVAGQALKAAGVRAAILDGNFLSGLNGNDHNARCRSVGSLLESLQSRPMGERAAVTRLLLSQGLNYLSVANAPR